MTNERVVIDTSVFISGAITPNGTASQSINHVFRHHSLLLSNDTLVELASKFASNKISKFVTPAKTNALLLRCMSLGIMIEPDPIEPTSRDPEDDMFLALALSGNARTIVSLDKDLLVLHPWRGIQILKPAAFLARSVLNQ